MTTKQLNFKDRSYYFYNDLINVWNFDKRHLKVDRKTRKDINIYYFGYIGRKPEWLVNSMNQLYFIVNRSYGIVSSSEEEKDKKKYLTITEPDDVSKKYSEIFSEIRQKIKKVSSEEVIYDNDFKKIQLCTDDNLPLKKLIYFPTP